MANTYDSSKDQSADAALYRNKDRPHQEIQNLIDRIENTLAYEDEEYHWGPIGLKWLQAHGARDNPNGLQTIHMYQEREQLLKELLQLLNEKHKQLSNEFEW